VKSSLIHLFLRISSAVPVGIISRFSRLRKNLAKAGIRIEFNVYFGLMIFTALVSLAATFAASLPFLLFFKFSALFAVATAASISLLAGAVAIGICYSYPMLEISSRKKNIDVNLSLTANYMAVLASSGMPPESIFESLDAVGNDLNVNKEVGGIMRDIKLMGLDLHTALGNASESSPSPKFSTILDGVITTSQMGGNLSGYLREQADKLKRERMQNLRRFVDNLSVVAEAYVTFLVALPLMLIVMLSILSFIGGEISVLSLNPMMVLNILSAVIIPTGISMMILAIDYLSPKR
jgi:flagellar protein FlaJ